MILVNTWSVRSCESLAWPRGTVGDQDVNPSQEHHHLDEMIMRIDIAGRFIARNLKHNSALGDREIKT